MTVPDPTTAAALAALALPAHHHSDLLGWFSRPHASPQASAPPLLPSGWTALQAPDGMRTLFQVHPTHAMPLRCLTVDRGGQLCSALHWALDTARPRLTLAQLRTPGGWMALHPNSTTHPLWRRCDGVHMAASPERMPEAAAAASTPSEPLARLPALDYASLEHLPPLDRPGALPPGAGSALLNLLAQLAQDQGRETLRYRGPYPTDALFASLGRCFSHEGAPEAARKTFTASFAETAATGALVINPLPWRPRPFWERRGAGGLLVQGHSENGTDTPTQLWLGKRAYTRTRQAGLCLWPLAANDSWAAGLRLLGEVWREDARIAASGTQLEEPSNGLNAPNSAAAPLLANATWGTLVQAWAIQQSATALAAAVQAMPLPRVLWSGLRHTLAEFSGDDLHVQRALPERFLARKSEDGAKGAESATALAPMLLSDLLETTAPLLHRQAADWLLTRPTPEASALMEQGDAAQLAAVQTLFTAMPALVARLNAAQRLEHLA